MNRLFGPPGTGKTTTLLNMVDDALSKGVSPQRIAFLAFTRKAATEAKERAADRFKLNAVDDLPFFRTLHSFAYRSLRINKQDLMQKEHFDELSKKMGIPLNITKNTNFDSSHMHTVEHPVLGLINLSRLKKTTLQEEYNSSDLEEPWHEVDYIDRSYQKYKSLNRLLDYTDMLSLFVEQAETICPNFDFCFLDEGQDLSPLQWDIAHILDNKSNRMYVAGDDDQAIFTFAGASIDYFQSLDSGAEVLEQSYRIPQAVHSVAEKIASRISNRFPKTYKPKAERGSVEHLTSIQELDMSENTWIVMAQANYMLSSVAEELKSLGYLFERNGARSISEKTSLAINGWEQLRKGNYVSLPTAQAIYSYMTGNGVRIVRGKKKLVGDDQDLLSLTGLQTNHGLLATKDMVWHEALDKLPDVDRAYITALLRRGEKFNSAPRIKLSTIHQTKGGEADCVVVFLDLTAAALKGPIDNLHRLFYVAVTRTKNKLFLIAPDDYGRSYDL